MQSQNEFNNLNNVPIEILFHIFSFERLETASSVLRVNKQLSSASQAFWKEKCRKHLPAIYAKEMAWPYPEYINWFEVVKLNYRDLYRYLTPREKEILYWLFENNVEKFTQLNIMITELLSDHFSIFGTIFKIMKDYRISDQRFYDYFYKMIKRYYHAIMNEEELIELIRWTMKCKQPLAEIKTSINVKTTSGRMIQSDITHLILVAIDNELPEVVEYFINEAPHVILDQSIFKRCISACITTNNIGILKILLAATQQFHAEDVDLSPFVVEPVQRKQLETLKIFVQYGLININKYGNTTLLHEAAKCKSYEIMSYLLENGANTKSKDSKNNLAIEYLPLEMIILIRSDKIPMRKLVKCPEETRETLMLLVRTKHFFFEQFQALKIPCVKLLDLSKQQLQCLSKNLKSEESLQIINQIKATMTTSSANNSSCMTFIAQLNSDIDAEERLAKENINVKFKPEDISKRGVVPSISKSEFTSFRKPVVVNQAAVNNQNQVADNNNDQNQRWRFCNYM